MTALTTTWTEQSAVEFNQSTLATTNGLAAIVESNINRGTLGTSSKPTSSQVTGWLIRAKEELQEVFGFTWRRVFSYADTVAGTYRYALPKDFAGGGTVLRDLTQNKRLSYASPIVFDTLFPDVDGGGNATPHTYTIKDRELWLNCEAAAVYRLELEYERSGEDSTAETWSYLPEAMLFKLTDYATYRAFMVLQDWNASQIYKAEWGFAVKKSTKSDARKKWASINYMAQNWHYVK